MIKSIKLVPHSIALLTGAAILTNAVSIAHAGDPDTRRPLYVVSVNRIHQNDQYANSFSGNLRLGQSPWNGSLGTDGKQYWGHWVDYTLQMLDNNRSPYGHGNPVEEFHDQHKNPAFSSGASPTYQDGQQIRGWHLRNGTSTFVDSNNWAITPRLPGSYSGAYIHAFSQRWVVYVRKGEGASTVYAGTDVRTDSVHRVTHSEQDANRYNLSG